jgi:HD domain-containing protein
MKKLRVLIVKNFEVALIFLILIGVLSVAFLVHDILKLSFLNFFFLPVILAGYFLGKNRGALIAVFCVLVMTLYMVLTSGSSGGSRGLGLNEVINLVSWGGFLILTGAILDIASEQREKRIAELRDAYIGVLEIMFKYLECADEFKPSSLRIAGLAGKIAAAAGLPTRDQENIKSAALLSSAGNLKPGLPLLTEMTDILGDEFKSSESGMGDREKVMLKATESLLKEVRPLLDSFHSNYVQGAGALDKNLEAVPIGSSILALANIFDKIESKSPPYLDVAAYASLAEIQKLSGRTFPSEAVEALIVAVTTP